MRRNRLANIIAALNQDCVAQASNVSGAEEDIDLELGLCTLTAACGCAAHPFPYPVIVISDSFRLAALCALPAVCRYGLNFPDAYQTRNALMTLYRS